MSLLDGIDSAVENAQEPVAVDAGSEVKLRIIGVTVAKDKNDLDYVMPRFEIVGNDLAKDFTKFLHIPNNDAKEAMDAKKFTRTAWSFKEFLATFGIDASRPGDPEDDWVGLEGWAIVGLEKSSQYGEQNFVRKFVAPK